MCGIHNVPGSARPDVCSYKDRFANLAFFMAADGGGAMSGDITWKCCNCVRDIPRGGLPTMGLAEYEKMACFQCKSRPPELCIQMRQQNFINNPPPSFAERNDTKNDKYRIMFLCGILVVGGLAGVVAAIVNAVS